jgi:hypothetical protein
MTTPGHDAQPPRPRWETITEKDVDREIALLSLELAVSALRQAVADRDRAAARAAMMRARAALKAAEAIVRDFRPPAG